MIFVPGQAHPLGGRIPRFSFPLSLSFQATVVLLKPLFYLHVLNQNTNVTRLEVGPQIFTRQDHELILLGPQEYTKIPPRHYVYVSNPAIVDSKTKQALVSSLGEVKLKYGDEEIRFHTEPFPLYPGETLKGKITPLQFVESDTALQLVALRSFLDDSFDPQHPIQRDAGDEWLFPGPNTYIPRVEVNVIQVQKATIINHNEGLRLRAKRATRDKMGNIRMAGEEWMIQTPGSYLPGIDEEIVSKVKAFVLTDKQALHLRALRSFTDDYGKKRQAGEEWLVTRDDSETHIPNVYEEVVRTVKNTVLTHRQYAVVVNPIGLNGKPQLGRKELRRGECSFFLYPGEMLENGIQSVIILGSEEALLLRALDFYRDGKTIHPPGDRWMIRGPCDYVPPVEVEILETRPTIPLDENEGIYIRDIKTGSIRCLTGHSYLLAPHEELWSKELPSIVEDLVSKAGQERGSVSAEKDSNKDSKRDKTRAVSYRVPHNAAVQIYDYKRNVSRIIFGPDLAILQPDEQFTVLNLSAGRPKKPNAVQTLCLFLGPDFMTDLVTVETSDHARLAIQLAYSWYFDVTPQSDKTQTSKLFQVPDFVGDACKIIAGRVRAVVASTSFDSFHKNSAHVIREAVFGEPNSDGVYPPLAFSANNLIVTEVDIQSVETVDQKTRDSLQKSVQLAIEITIKSQEASARHEADRVEQEAKGKLERQKITDEAEAENIRRFLLELQAQSAATESTGQAAAEAKAKAEAANIEGKAAVRQAQQKAEATNIQSKVELEQKRLSQQAALKHQQALNELEIQKAREFAAIEVEKFREVVEALGSETIKSIAIAGPTLQAKLLQGLGLKSFLITDGNSPINLFNTAKGLIGGS